MEIAQVLFIEVLADKLSLQKSQTRARKFYPRGFIGQGTLKQNKLTECMDEDGMDPWEVMPLQGHPHLSLKGHGDHGSSQEQEEPNATPVIRKDRKGG